MVARVVPVEPFDFVVLGGTGDLARRKLIPALYHRLNDGQMPATARIIGAATRPYTTEVYREFVANALDEFVDKDALDPECRQQFLECISYQQIDANSGKGWSELKELTSTDDARPRVFYLSIAPSLFDDVVERLRDVGLTDWPTRIVVEKPLGHDLASAQHLNACLAAEFDEHQIYRIDHYLGKETVQNLMALRFANALFEPLWNSSHIDNVQITVAETVGVGGRGRYYDHSGALRDMVQNHLLQLLCLIAMEPPARFEPNAVRDEKLKVLRALAPLTDLDDVVRGQYGAINGSPSYTEDVNNGQSRTESFVALKAAISNWRWAGVPFYLRTGKRLRARVSEIALTFKEVPHSIFPSAGGRAGNNVLVIRLQPDEGIRLIMTIKDPGPGGMRLAPAELDMTFDDTLKASKLRMPDAYERLVMDVVRGDQTLFMRGDEVEAAWAWIDPIVDAWEEAGHQPVPYDPGSSGPDDALMLLHRDGRRWRDIN
ncbi:MAG: glucose-6-phosphate dehydrogenase [Pseudomonadota bacterium]